jgi:hypothetical protein
MYDTIGTEVLNIIGCAYLLFILPFTFILAAPRMHEVAAGEFIYSQVSLATHLIVLCWPLFAVLRHGIQIVICI